MSMSLGNLTEEYRAHALLNELQSLYSSPYSATSSRSTIGPDARPQEPQTKIQPTGIFLTHAAARIEGCSTQVHWSIATLAHQPQR